MMNSMTVKVDQKKIKLNYGTNDNKIIKEENVQEFSESEFENILNLCKRRCARMLSNSKDENESILQDHQNEIAVNGNS
uniref:Uncharacterized protein n=1 Tax=Vespula pensylvanica TaxID=30213 RepID=A0A834K0P9_VESPE|nr:hypothetical protein H0235_016719 [Vespula pensylvanica]